MAEVRVGDVSTLLILDTGADTHLVTQPVADALGLVADGSTDGRDASGASITSAVVGSLDAEIDGAMWTMRDVVAIPSPLGFDDLGIGGFLSPQRLSKSATVLDLARDVLVETSSPKLGGIPLRHRGGLLTLDVSVSGRPAVVGFIDTGSATTDVSASAAGVAVDAAETSGRGVSGASIESTTTSLDLSFGVGPPIARQVEVRGEIPSPPEIDVAGGFGALIGMDLLRGSTVVMTPTAGSGWFPASSP